MELVPAIPDEPAAAWEASARAPHDFANGTGRREAPDLALTAQFLVLVTCRDEKEQVGRLKEKGRESSEGSAKTDLTPVFCRKARDDYVSGNYEDAIFKAFKLLDEAVRGPRSRRPPSA